MPHSLILPKQTGRKDVFFASLKLFYSAYISGELWVSNDVYKREIQNLIPDLKEGARDNAYLVKQSELTRYFGLAYRDYPGKRTKITDTGVQFYEAFLHGNQDKMADILVESVFKMSFGRNNTAIKNSNSDVDAPKLFFKAMLDLGGITRRDLAYLIYVTHDKKVSYSDALNEFKSAEAEREINIPSIVSNKYSDVKFTVLLTHLGICVEKENKYEIAPEVLKKYGQKIRALSIYNKSPDIVLSLNEELVEAEEENVEEELENSRQKRIFTSFAYDINGEKFMRQNNREPVAYKTTKGERYKTNPRIAKTALLLSANQCQIDREKHSTFTSKLGQQYMEAHHLIPMHAQKDFKINLDRVENIVSICPNCHAAIHLGNDAVRLNHVAELYKQKISELNGVGIEISIGDLFSKYYK